MLRTTPEGAEGEGIVFADGAPEISGVSVATIADLELGSAGAAKDPAKARQGVGGRTWELVGDVQGDDRGE